MEWNNPPRGTSLLLLARFADLVIAPARKGTLFRGATLFYISDNDCDHGIALHPRCIRLPLDGRLLALTLQVVIAKYVFNSQWIAKDRGASPNSLGRLTLSVRRLKNSFVTEGSEPANVKVCGDIVV